MKVSQLIRKYTSHLIKNITLKRIIVLGSTGSIGTQTLDVVRHSPHDFRVVMLTAYSSADLLIEQAREFKPEYVVIGKKSLFEYVRAALYNLPINVQSGTDAINQIVAEVEAHVVVTAMVGFAGLVPTLRAIESGKNIALANKETLVVAGNLVMNSAQKYGSTIIPVDSEHSAIFQCLVGEQHESIEKIILTASGGPFRGFSKEQLLKVTKVDALLHPNWNMGSKITIDSATMMNKALEIIEAKWLFDVEPGQIDVVVHPQSIIHSMVQFVDGSIKAQMGLPDMRTPIYYALNYPIRINNRLERYIFNPINTLTFEKPNVDNFPALNFAYDVLRLGGNSACIVNAANEIAVSAFLSENISFVQIPTIIQEVLGKVSFIKTPSLSDYIETDLETRNITLQIIENIKTKS